VRHGVSQVVREQGLESLQVREVRREKRVGDGLSAEFGSAILRILFQFSEEHLACERVSIRVETGGWKAERHVTRAYAASIENLLAVDDPDDRSRNVVLPGRIEARHLRRLTAEEGDTVLSASAGHAFDDLLQGFRLELPGRDVVEEEERLCPLNEDVVDAVIDEIRAAGVVPSRLECDLELRPDAVGGRNEDRVAIRREVRPKQPAEPSDVSENAGCESRPDRTLCALERCCLRVDVDAGGDVPG
jgi:hypothetical protein